MKPDGKLCCLDIQALTKGWSLIKVGSRFTSMAVTYKPFLFPPGQSTMPPKAPPMPREVIEPLLCTNRLTAQDPRALPRSEGWNCLESWNAQLVFRADFAEIERGITLDTQELADIFQVTRSPAHKVLYKERFALKLPHRPTTLKLEQEDVACQWIRNAASTGNFGT
jgi:hypothetical protein